MSIYWNTFTILFINNTGYDLAVSTPQIISRTVQSALPVPKNTASPGLKAFFGQSSSDSTSGASGYAKWTTPDGVVCNVYYNAPNTGDPAGLPTLDGINAGNYKFTGGEITCSGSGCNINSGYRGYTMTVTLDKNS